MYSLHKLKKKKPQKIENCDFRFRFLLCTQLIFATHKPTKTLGSTVLELKPILTDKY